MTTSQIAEKINSLANNSFRFAPKGVSFKSAMKMKNNQPVAKAWEANGKSRIYFNNMMMFLEMVDGKFEIVSTTSQGIYESNNRFQDRKDRYEALPMDRAICRYANILLNK